MSARLLIADDDRDHAEGLAALVELRGVEVELAFDGDSAIERLRRGALDLAVVDAKMPGTTGFQVVAAVLEQGLAVPSFLMSGFRLAALFEYHTRRSTRVADTRVELAAAIQAAASSSAPSLVLSTFGGEAGRAAAHEELARRGVQADLQTLPGLPGGGACVVDLGQNLVESVVGCGSVARVLVVLGPPRRGLGPRDPRLTGCISKPLHREDLDLLDRLLAEPLRG